MLWTFSTGCMGRVGNYPSGDPISLAADAPPLHTQSTQGLKHNLILHTSREKKDNPLFSALTWAKFLIKL